MYTHYSGSKLYLHRDIKRSARHTSAVSRSGRYVSGHKSSQNGIHRTVTYFTRHAHLDDIFKMAENMNSDEITDEVFFFPDIRVSRSNNVLPCREGGEAFAILIR